MKLYILSDLHLDFPAPPFKLPAVDAHVVILAGDVHHGYKGLEWARETFPDKTVLYVLGNHEYYGEALPKHAKKLKREAAGTNVHVLEDDSREIAGIRFLGCTLWTDFKLFGEETVAAYEAQRFMNDYRRVRVNPSYCKLRPAHTMALHRSSRGWLEAELKRGNKKCVVITHHAPSLLSMPMPYRSDLLSAAYASALDDLIAETQPLLWIHGHIHTRADYTIGNTRVVCNPRGYPDEHNKTFNSELVIEI